MNNEFIETLSDALQEYIIDSEVIITAKSSMGLAGDESEVITRKVFLLSQQELGLRTKDSLTTVSEGKKLKYFVEIIHVSMAAFQMGKNAHTGRVRLKTGKLIW